MNLALAFTRTLFVFLSIFFMTVYMISGPFGHTPEGYGFGCLLGLGLGALLIGFDLLVKKFNLRSFNIVVVGLFVGYLMGRALVGVFGAILEISTASIHLNKEALEVIEIAIFLFSIYLGTIMTLRASDELYISIPFVRFAQTIHHKKDLVLDSSILADTRILDMAGSGLVDNHLVIPRFVLKELHFQTESPDAMTSNRAKRAIETSKKLEASPGLELRFSDTDFPDVHEPVQKLLRLARLLDANVLTAENIGKIQMSGIDEVRIININSLSNALKPLMQAGEHIRIKIQRYGKEPRQGVGYLEDGTMVVVNGGGDYIGETIETLVLSVKHTSSGRIIFCNTLDEHHGMPNYDDDESQ